MRVKQSNITLLDQNDSQRQEYSLPLLLSFAMFSVWNLSVISYTGKTVWELGGSGLYIHSTAALTITIATKVLAIALILLFPRHIVRLIRGLCIGAAASGAILLLPLDGMLLQQAAILAHQTCQRTMGALCPFLVIFLLREKSAVAQCTITAAAATLLAALLQNGFVTFPPELFRALMVLLPAAQLFFYYALPKRPALRYAKKEDGLACPKKLFAGVFFLVFLCGILFLFGHAFAERHSHGMLIFYCSAAAAGIAVFVLYRRHALSPDRLIPALLGLGVLAFVAALLSEYLPFAAPIACVLFGASGTALTLIYLSGIALVKQHPSAIIVPGILLFELAATYTRTGLLTLFYFNHTFLNIAQIAIAVSAMVIYLVLQPYLTFGFREGPVQAAKPAQSPGWRETLQANAYERLTDGELDVAGLIMRGYKNEEIAAETKYTLDTVKTYRKWLYSKLDVHSTRELFALAEQPRRPR